MLASTVLGYPERTRWRGTMGAAPVRDTPTGSGRMRVDPSHLPFCVHQR
jgi:hypothetical protein